MGLSFGVIVLIMEGNELDTVSELVSVIVPVYNAENYLQECIDSLITQTYKKIEIILINDGSQDNSIGICRRNAVKDKRIKVFDNENKGVSATRNMGIKQALGKYICFVDSDDYVEKQYIFNLVNQVKENVIPFCGYILDVHTKEGIKCQKRTCSLQSVIDVQSGIVNLFSHGFLSPIWNKIYEKQILINNNIFFDESISLGEDLIFNLMYLKAGMIKFANVKQELYHYKRYEKESLDYQYRSDFLRIQQKLYTELIETCDTFKVSEEDKNSIYFLFFSALIVSIDNCFLAKEQSKDKVKTTTIEVLKTIKNQNLLANIRGWRGVVSKIRYLFIKCNMFIVDYRFRCFLKKMLNLS